MAAVAEKLSLPEFQKQYGSRKPSHEFWFGEAIPKAMPTWIHGLLQGILIQLFKEIGYRAGSEVKLKISPQFEPVPDVIATSTKIELPYPTKPFDAVVEILSPEDSFQRLLRKCKLYSEWGIPGIFVIDADERDAWAWDKNTGSLSRIQALQLGNGKNIALARIFSELDTALR